jgi:hypothetical protein
MADDSVADAEQVYRRVANNPNLFSVTNGILHLSTAAFNDPSKQPSVDRAKLRGHDPTLAKTAPTQGVVGFLAEEARRIGSVTTNDANGNVVVTHQVDIVPDRLEENLSHALVVVEPGFTSKRPFDRLKESLARIAERQGWLVNPS